MIYDYLKFRKDSSITSQEIANNISVALAVALSVVFEIRLFVDDCVCYREIKDKEDTLKLQRDIDRLGTWARKWGMRFQPVKCNMMQLTRKHSNKIQASKMPDFDVFSLLEIRKRKRRSHGKRQKGNDKRKRCAAQKSGTSLNNLSSKLREHGQHEMLSFLSSLPIPVLCILDIEANRV